MRSWLHIHYDGDIVRITAFKMHLIHSNSFILINAFISICCCCSCTPEMEHKERERERKNSDTNKKEIEFVIKRLHSDRIAHFIIHAINMMNMKFFVHLPCGGVAIFGDWCASICFLCRFSRSPSHLPLIIVPYFTTIVVLIYFVSFQSGGILSSKWKMLQKEILSWWSQFY